MLLPPRLDPVPGAAQAVVERDLRPPAQFLLDVADVERAPPDVALAWCLEPRWLSIAADRPAMGVQIGDARLDTAAR